MTTPCESFFATLECRKNAVMERVAARRRMQSAMVGQAVCTQLSLGPFISSVSAVILDWPSLRRAISLVA